MARPKKEVTKENIEKFQKELELAGNRVDILLKDKKGRSKSCLLCRRRKQRCDHKLPSCTTCLKAGVKCIQPARYIFAKNNNISSSKSGSSRKSEDTNGSESTSEISRVSSITDNPEASVRTNFTEHEFDDTGGSVSGYNLHNDLHFRDISKYIENLEKKLKFLEGILYSNSDKTTIGQKIGQYEKMSSRMATGEEPLDHDPAPSAASDTLPTTVEQQDSNRPKRGKLPVRTCSSSKQMSLLSYSDSIFADYELNPLLSQEPIVEFDEVEMRNSLEIFLTKLQFAYYAVHEDSVRKFQDDYINNNLSSYQDIEFTFACARMWLIQAIVARFYRTIGRDYGEPPERYFATAIGDVVRCTDRLDMKQELALKMLLLMYLLGTGYDFDTVYVVIGDSIKLCNEMVNFPMRKSGLDDQNRNDGNGDSRADSWHTKNASVQPREIRIFWSLYLLERIFCTALGRAFFIRESDIVLPVLEEEDFTNISMNHQGSVYFSNELLMLQRLESKYVEKLGFVPNMSIFDNGSECGRAKLPLLMEFFRELDHWRSECKFDNLNEHEKNLLRFHYCRAIKLMTVPFLKILTPERKLFKKCQIAAGEICQMYRSFRERSTIYFLPLIAHIFFTSGVTLIYSLWLTWNYEDEKQKQLGSPSGGSDKGQPVTASLLSALDGLRSSSISLYAATEKCKFAQFYRDMLDQLMDATVGNLIGRCKPDSPGPVFSHRKGKEERSNNNTVGSGKSGSIPHGLSHLLIEVNPDEAENESNKGVTMTESPLEEKDTDWKIFVYQAFWRQYFARPSLKKSLFELGKIDASSNEPVVGEKGVELRNLETEEKVSKWREIFLQEAFPIYAQQPATVTYVNGQLGKITWEMIQNIFEWVNKSVNEMFTNEAEFQEFCEYANYFRSKDIE